MTKAERKLAIINMILAVLRAKPIAQIKHKIDLFFLGKHFQTRAEVVSERTGRSLQDIIGEAQRIGIHTVCYKYGFLDLNSKDEIEREKRKEARQ